MWLCNAGWRILAMSRRNIGFRNFPIVLTAFSTLCDREVADNKQSCQVNEFRTPSWGEIWSETTTFEIIVKDNEVELELREFGFQ